VIPALWFGAAVVGTPAAVGWAQAGVAAVALVVNLAVARRLFDLPLQRALVGLVPSLAASGAMALAVLALLPWVEGLPDLLQVGFCAALGAVVYALALRILAREFFETGARVVAETLTRRGHAEATS
jgi:hypothetical protein